MTSKSELASIVFVAVLAGVLFEVSFLVEVPIDDSQSDIIQGLNHARLPFVENQGQIQSDYVKYYAKTFAGTVYVTDYDLTYHSIKKQGDSSILLAIKEKFLGNHLLPQGTQKSQAVMSYFKGYEKDWKTNIPTYDDISLGPVWQNVDVNLSAYGNNVEKIFTVHPDGDVSDIRVAFEGITGLSVSGKDELVVNTEIGQIMLSKPIAYQEIDGKKHNIPVWYKILDSYTYGFSVLSYDPRFDLVIDPLIASTFAGGSGSDTAQAIVLSDLGNVYVTGGTDDALTDFPTTVGAYNTTHAGSVDVFVSKFNFALTMLSASTLIGSTGGDGSNAIALDSSGNVYITGYAEFGGTQFPTTVGAYNTTNAGGDDVFVSKFNGNLTSLLASTFIGGSDLDEGTAIALDSSGNVYITGSTTNAVTDLPTTVGAYDTVHNGLKDAFASKFNSSLSSLLASTFLGSSGTDDGFDIAIGDSGDVYVIGRTPDDTTDLPTTAGAYDTVHNGGNDVFVSKFNSALTTLSASTFIGGSSTDSGSGLVLDGSNNVYITGETTDHTTDFPTTAGAYDTTHNGASDIFVSKLNSALTTLSASTFIGGSGNDFGHSIAIDSSSHSYVTGRTQDSGTDLPTTAGAYDTTHNGATYDVFVSKFNSDLSTLSASTFIGGIGNELGYGITVDDAGNVFITGETQDVATDYPTTAGAYDTTHNGSNDVFVSYFDCDLLLAGEACTPELGDGDSVSVTVGAGGTAEVELPSGNNLSVKLPAGVSGTINFTDTDSGSSASSISFFGDIINIDPIGGATCSGGCTISFTFTSSDAEGAGLSPSQAKIYHDSSENGSFESGESLSTTVTGSGPYNATATASFTSKFAVGGVRANAVAAAQSLSAGGFFDFLDSCDPNGFAPGKSLEIYEISYDKCESHKMQVLAYSTCGPITAQVTTGSGRYTLGMPSTQPFINDREKKIVFGAEISSDLESFNLLLKDKRDSFTDKIYLSQCSATKSYSHQTGYTSEQQSPFFYGSFDTLEGTTQPQVIQPDLQPILVEPEPVALEPDQISHTKHTDPEPSYVDPEPSYVDPEPSYVDPEPSYVDPEPVFVDPEPVAKTKNNLFEGLLKTFSRIFHRQ